MCATPYTILNFKTHPQIHNPASPGLNCECAALVFLEQKWYTELNDVFHYAPLDTGEALVHATNFDGGWQRPKVWQV